MKGLLHSKLFRKNLFKWLFMYVTVIGLFTSVVTYSKYISSMQGGDTAKVAKFDASITYDKVCAIIGENEICDNGTFRPTTKISYYFTVDTRELEVSTIFVTLITVDSRFKNIQIYDVTEDIREIIPSTTDGNKFTLIDDDLKVDETTVTNYKITMELDYENMGLDDGDYDANLNTHTLQDAVIIGYSATQKK